MPPPAPAPTPTTTTTTATAAATSAPDYVADISLGVSVLGTVLSLIGLIFTLKVYERIKQGYQRKGLIPKSQKNLKTLRGKIAAELKNKRENPDVGGNLGRISSELRHLATRLDPKNQKDNAMRALLDRTLKLSVEPSTDNAELTGRLESLLAHLDELDTDLDNLLLNDQWAGE